MKCVKHNGSVERVGEKRAMQLIAAGGLFVQKAEWKKEDPERQARQESHKKSVEAKVERDRKKAMAPIL